MNAAFNFHIFQPQGLLSPYIQAVWSASVSSEKEIRRWLYSDGGSGILFILTGTISLIDADLLDSDLLDTGLLDARFSEGVLILPTGKQSQQISLSPQAQLAGIRFHPAVGRGVLGDRFEHVRCLTDSNEIELPLHNLRNELTTTAGHHARITLLYRWLKSGVDFSAVIPDSLMQSVSAIRADAEMLLANNLHSNSNTPILTPLTHKQSLEQKHFLSQRQIERQFQKWVGITPKHYQRILRVRKTLEFLRRNPQADLVNLALDNGFTDQAHMTREFNSIAKITPKKFCNLVSKH